MRSYINILLYTVLIFMFIGCGGGGGSDTNTSNNDNSPTSIDENKNSDNNTPTPTPDPLDIPDMPTVEALGFTIVDDTAWNELAVKKVLDTFAYGGHATDAQIKLWADMSPSDAIVQMLTNAPKNALLSPSSSNLPNSISLEALASFWSGSSSDNFVDESKRDNFLTNYNSWSVHKNSWALAVMSRGLNPFLHRVGLWETNYHMSINADSGVYPIPILHHYDNILSQIALDKPYDEVIAQGAKNAGVAYQYGHNKNIFTDGQFKGNEDFAREYHQLYLGILGDYNHTYHEETTIPYTARALTDMVAQWKNGDNGGPDTEIIFGTDNHYTGELNILNSIIPTSATADTQLDAIAKLGIEHEESLDNLPLMIIRHFGDDNLTTNAIANIQESWKSMSKKSIISFLRSYAISTDFHSPSRYRYKTSIDRTIGVANMMVVDNSDNIYGYYDPNYYLSAESIETFHPIHDVFGHQTSLEASANANIFQVNYNRSIEKSSYYTRSYKEIDKVSVWEKDWAKIIPTDNNGEYKVKDVGLWLWKRFIGDGGKNYGELEQAHITALLNGKDLPLFLDDTKPLEVYNLDDIKSSNIAIKINDGKVAKMSLNSNITDDRRDANKRVGLAIAFIVATPYIYAQEGI